MGRYVNENGDRVWKYVFAEQGSEQGRIYVDYGIGRLELEISKGCQNDGDCDTCKSEECSPVYMVDYNEVSDNELKDSTGDIMLLEYKDIYKLKQIVESIPNFEEAKRLHNEEWEKHSTGMPFDDCKKLFEQTSKLCGKDIFNFGRMVERYIEHMEKQHAEKGRTEFYFEGEY